MGWLTMANCRNATDVKNHLFKGIEESPSTELLASKSTCYGRHLWMAIKLTREGQAPSVGIVLCLLGADSNGWWGYKDIGEEMGPVETDCPVALLDLCTEPLNEWAKNWREKVRALAEKRTLTYKAGDLCTIYGRQYEVLGKMPGKRSKAYRVRRIDTGGIFKATPAKMNPVTPAPVA